MAQAAHINPTFAGPSISPQFPESHSNSFGLEGDYNGKKKVTFCPF